MGIMIDTIPEIIAAGAAALAIVVAAVLGLVAIARRGRLSLGGATVGGDPPCAPFVIEHSEILTRLEAAMARVEGMISGQGVLLGQIDAMQGPQIAAQRIVIKKIRSEFGRDDEGINGDLDEAWEEIRDAELKYREMRRIG